MREPGCTRKSRARAGARTLFEIAGELSLEIAHWLMEPSNQGMPPMSERTIFMAAVEKSMPEQRAAFLDEACAGDAALRERIEALLRSHEEAGSFLGQPVPERVAAAL